MKTTEITIKDFVGNSPEANSIITDFTYNKYIIKGSTGIGGTTSIFNITNQTVIIISPLVGMIQSKEEKKQPHHKFIYGGSQDSWKDVLNSYKNGENQIINTTPESFISILKGNTDFNNDLAPYLLSTPLFVDEFDIYTSATYRINLNKTEYSKLEEFYYHLFNCHNSPFTLSTATPSYLNLDIPSNVNIKYFVFKLEVNQVKVVNRNPLSNYYNWVKGELSKGNKVVLFTNDIKKINRFRNNSEDIKVQVLSGEGLAVKISETKKQDIEEWKNIQNGIIDYSNDLFILSTRYLIGFDFNEDASVGVIMDENSKTDNLTTNMFIQAYGRIRKNVINAAVFLRSNEFVRNVDREEKRLINDYMKVSENGLNHLKEIAPIINNIHLLHTYNQFEKDLIKHNFIIVDNDDISELATQSFNFTHKYNEIVKQDYEVTINQFNLICDNIQGDDKEFVGFNSKRLLIWAVSVLAEYFDYLKYLTPQRYEELLNTTKAILDVNEIKYNDELSQSVKYRVCNKSMGQVKDSLIKEDNYNLAVEYSKNDSFNKARKIIHTLYTIQMVQNDEYDKKIVNFTRAKSDVMLKMKNNIINHLKKSAASVEEYIQDRNIINLNGVINYTLVGKKLTSIIKKDVLKLKSLELLSEDEIVIINKKINETIYTFSKYELNNPNNATKFLNDIYHLNLNIQRQKDNHKNYLLALLSIEIAGHMNGFRVTNKDDREYNPATKCSKQLRSITPFKLAEFDIASTFPTILNKLIGSDNHNQYEKVMKKNNITRAEAKVLFNIHLNSTHLLSTSKKEKEFNQFFLDCGYQPFEVERIHNVVKGDGRVGTFFRQMTVIEKRIIKEFTIKNKIEKLIRIHDSIITYQYKGYEGYDYKIEGLTFKTTIL